MTKRKFWTDQELKILSEMYPDHYTIDIANKLNRSVRSVYSMANIKGLKKSPAFFEMELSIQAERLKIVGTKSRYQKGREPENKGSKMNPEIYAKLKPTMFKKGHKPHNLKYDNHERINVDGYHEVRVSEGKYVAKHRLLWENINGPIPKGMAIIFKDRNPNNITIENLEMVSRDQLMVRNSIQRFSPELISAIKLVKKLKNKINAKEQN